MRPRFLHAAKLLVLALTLTLVGAACGSSSSTVAAVDQTTSSNTATTSQDDAPQPSDSAEAADVGQAAAPQRFEVPPLPADGLYKVGDTYYDAYLSATHLGLAKVAVDPIIYTGGECYTVLLTVSWYDVNNDPGISEKFRASTSGLLASGAEAERDPSGLGCDTTPLPALGYERSISTSVGVGETVQVYLGSIHVPDGESLDSVVLYGSRDTRFDAQVTLDASQ